MKTSATPVVLAGLCLGISALAHAQEGDQPMTAAAKRKTFSDDVAFLRRHTEVVVLRAGDAQVAVAPAYQARVMTSTTGGKKDLSFGWLNYPVIEKGVLPAGTAKGKLEDHIYVFGGEERFWLGPEGGQFAIFFAPGAKFVFDDWHTPPAIDTEPFALEAKSDTEASFRRDLELVNYSGTRFKAEVRRTVRLLPAAEAATALGVTLPASVRSTAYETRNELCNRGDAPWRKETGLLSIWLLGMYNPSAGTTIVIPFKPGPESELGPKVNDTYFGKVPPERLIVKDAVLFFSGDGTYRSKIGISPRRSRGVAGSYDEETQVLTLVLYNQPAGTPPYVNSMWELQKDPFAGDAINSYNDGAPGPGQKPLGPFYELETSSPAAELKPGERLVHTQRTFHLEGSEKALNAAAETLLGVSIADIKKAF